MYLGLLWQLIETIGKLFLHGLGACLCQGHEFDEWNRAMPGLFPQLGTLQDQIHCKELVQGPNVTIN